MPSLASTSPTVYSGLTERARDVLAALESHDKRGTGKVWPGIERLAAMIGVCRRTVERAVKDLVGVGLVNKQYRHRRSSLYTLNWQAIVALGRRIMEAMRPPAAPDPAPPTVAQESHQGGSENWVSVSPAQQARAKTRSGVAREQPKAEPTDRPPTIYDVQARDLADDERTEALFEQAAAKGLAPKGEYGRLCVFSAACKALRIGKRPGAMFAGILRKKLWKWATNTDEDAATERIKSREGRGMKQKREEQRERTRREERASAPPRDADAEIWGSMLDTLRGNTGALRHALASKGWSVERIDGAASRSPRTLAWAEMRGGAL